MARRYGEIKRDPAKVRHAASPFDLRKLNIEVTIRRTLKPPLSHGGRHGEYTATACVRNKGGGGSRPGQRLFRQHRCRSGVGPTPTRAIGQALSLLGNRIRAKKK